MASFTPNKGLAQPVVGADIGQWGTELNSATSILDNNLGGTAPVNMAGGSNVTATAAQAQCLIQNLTGAITANVQYILPALGGFYLIENNTTGAFTVTIASVGGGSTVIVPQTTQMLVYCDGTNIFAPIDPIPTTAVVGVGGSSNVTATAQQAKSLVQNLNGTLTGNIQYTLPNVTANYGIANNTTGNFTLTVAAAGGGAKCIVPQGTTTWVWTDGTNLYPAAPKGWEVISITQVSAQSAVSIAAASTQYQRFKLTMQALTGSLALPGVTLFLQTAVGGTAQASGYSQQGILVTGGSPTYFNNTAAAGWQILSALTPTTGGDLTAEIIFLSAGSAISGKSYSANSSGTLVYTDYGGNAPSSGLSNALLITALTGTFSGTVILEGLPNYP